MFSQDWKRLYQKYGVAFNTYTEVLLPTNQPTEKLRFNEGRDKDKYATLIGFYKGQAIVRLDDGTIKRPAYQRVDTLDMFGEVNTVGPRDMLGEPIPEGAWIAYSRKSGECSHRFCLGRVIKFSKGGTLTVHEALQDGEPTGKGHNGRPVERTVPQKRALKLPCDPTRLTMAIFTDFASIDGSNG
jgi:hypothetical protein